jgi:hypothetical protein
MHSLPQRKTFGLRSHPRAPAAALPAKSPARKKAGGSVNPVIVAGGGAAFVIVAAVLILGPSPPAPTPGVPLITEVRTTGATR